ncbi:MAG: RICIN domain-containing protein [Ruminococcus bromii]|nr:RICIN domain-containing protein [Ruminococcus bromii]MEE0007394.1 RICIN domain-containing protein [Ruminococcus bromii]
MKKIISVMLSINIVVLLFVFSATFSVGAITQSEFDSRINSLRSQYPNYSTWANQSFDGGTECYGFARLIGYNVFGSYPSSWSRVYSIDNVKKGDILQYGNTSGSGHTVFVTNVSGDTITFVDCNGNGNYSGSSYVRYCGIKWDNTISKYGKMFNKYSFSYLLSSPQLDSDITTVDLGTDFYASITHIASWNHLTVEDNNNVDICWETYSDNQYWKFYKQYDGSYKIVSAKNDKCLDVENGSSDDGANIGVYENNDTDAQRWYIYKCGNGYQLKPKCSDCVMEMNAWNFYQGVNLVCGTKDNSDAEIFSINKRNFDELAETTLNYSDNNGSITFSWDTPKCASNYNLKIYNGNSVWNGEAPINIWNVQGNSYNIELGEGTFTAVLQTYNAIQDYHECKSLTFTTNVSSYSPVKTVVSKGHIYELYDKPTSWETAKLVCENKDGHLATITSSEEEKVIESLIRYGKRTFYNVGATNLENVNEWKWITGESMSYTNWAIGEPNNVANIERYLSVFNNENYFAQWNDTTNASTSGVSNGFICEYDGLACDVDLDGLVSVTDATLLQKYVVGIATLTDDQKLLADCNGDGVINVRDATYIQKTIVKIPVYNLKNS